MLHLDSLIFSFQSFRPNKTSPIEGIKQTWVHPQKRNQRKWAGIDVCRIKFQISQMYIKYTGMVSNDFLISLKQCKCIKLLVSVPHPHRLLYQ